MTSAFELISLLFFGYNFAENIKPTQEYGANTQIRSSSMVTSLSILNILVFFYN